jgi:hypothetical protein
VTTNLTEVEHTGAWRSAPNIAASRAGTIHDDATARGLGFAGGILGALVLLANMTPDLVALFGPAWYERGFLKQHYIAAVYADDPFRVVARPLPLQDGDERLYALSLEKPGGTVASTGYAGLYRSVAEARAPWERRGEWAVEPCGEWSEAETIILSPEHTAIRRDAARDDSPWYSERSPWGGSIAPLTLFQMISSSSPVRRATLPQGRGSRAGMNAAFQLVMTGPMFCGRPYVYRERVVEEGYSDRTAFHTLEFHLGDEAGQSIVRGRRKSRWFP